MEPDDCPTPSTRETSNKLTPLYATERTTDSPVQPAREPAIVDPPTVQPPDPVPGHGPKPQISVTIDFDDLRTATTNATGALVFGERLSAATVRRLACDADVLPLVLGSKSQPLDVGTTQRLVTRPIRRALNARDKGCVICNAPPIMCEAHHIIHWADGGITAISNLALLCKRHHLDLHSGHWQIRILNGVVQVTHPTWSTPTHIPPTKYHPPTTNLIHHPHTPPDPWNDHAPPPTPHTDDTPPPGPWNDHAPPPDPRNDDTPSPNAQSGQTRTPTPRNDGTPTPDPWNDHAPPPDPRNDDSPSPNALSGETRTPGPWNDHAPPPDLQSDDIRMRTPRNGNTPTPDPWNDDARPQDPPDADPHPTPRLRQIPTPPEIPWANDPLPQTTTHTRSALHIPWADDPTPPTTPTRLPHNPWADDTPTPHTTPPPLTPNNPQSDDPTPLQPTG
ncbi:HNH endonuclease signature motif containing protein [Kribbella hippodromi]|uniref:HNH endonuclease signature motif containing protein n=1 Tax=Kribbella hippodromi TaxID=434347 RepID=UPI0031CF1B4F